MLPNAYTSLCPFPNSVVPIIRFLGFTMKVSFIESKHKWLTVLITVFKIPEFRVVGYLTMAVAALFMQINGEMTSLGYTGNTYCV
jgi:hypothetical protein